MKRLLALLMVAVLALGLAACGRKGPPEVPPGTKDEYPRKYPGV
jgi:predicted small lipoprotein YifL